MWLTEAGAVIVGPAEARWRQCAITGVARITVVVTGRRRLLGDIDIVSIEQRSVGRVRIANATRARSKTLALGFGMAWAQERGARHTARALAAFVVG